MHPLSLKRGMPCARAMSQENVEVVRAAGDAVNRGDPEAFVACLSGEVEWEEIGNVLPDLSGIQRGRAEVRKWFERTIVEPWESFHSEEKEITAGIHGRVFAEVVATARGEASGIETNLRIWQVFTFADGKIARRQVFWDRTEALEAAGLPE